jgi:hypothetical protein
MELASMLAGDRFGDRPASVCPVIGSILRAYNDVIGEDLRQDLYRYASECVGTRGDFDLQHRRAAVAIAWARSGYRTRRGRGSLRARVARMGEPEPDSGPDGIAEYVIGSLRRRQTASSHLAMLWLLDRLIAMAAPVPLRTDPSPVARPEQVLTAPQAPRDQAPAATVRAVAAVGC